MDMPTLRIEHAVLLGLYTTLTVANSWFHRGTKGLQWFPVYNFYAFVGAILLALQGSIPAWSSVVCGPLFFSLAYVMLHRSLTEFFGKEDYQAKLQMLLCGVALVFLIRFGIIAPNAGMRLLSNSIILALQASLTAIFVFGNAKGVVRSSGWMMGALLCLLAASNLARTVSTLLHGAPAEIYGQRLVSWVLVSTSVLQGGVTVAFVWMTAADLRQNLHIQATTDPLTRLMNRRAFEMAADREITWSRMSGEPLSAIMIDLDGFKQINDGHGHQFGDAVLQGVAHCLQTGMRVRDQVGRLGGDEFVILLPGTPVGAAREIAERLRAHLETFEIASGESMVRVQASFGVSELTTGTRDWGQLMLNCDRALYSVKQIGGNQVEARI